MNHICRLLLLLCAVALFLRDESGAASAQCPQKTPKDFIEPCKEETKDKPKCQIQCVMDKMSMLKPDRTPDIEKVAQYVEGCSPKDVPEDAKKKVVECVKKQRKYDGKDCSGFDALGDECFKGKDKDKA